MSAFQKYSEHFKRFGENERKILEIFGLNGLEDIQLWTKLLGKDITELRAITSDYRFGSRFLTDFMPKVIVMLRQDHIKYITNKDNSIKEEPQYKDKVLLTVILPEDEKTQSNPDRLIKILQSISIFYNSLIIINQCPYSELSVAAIDSGSDKSFDFLGAAKTITAVKELIIGLWDRVVFFKERQLSERLDLISKSLPIFEKIAALEETNIIGREQAELLRRDITVATVNFISAGAVIPEFQNQLAINPRTLMAPEPKLLTNDAREANVASANEDVSDNDAHEDFTDEEWEEIKKILKKKKKNDKDNDRM